jgi:hypothetical protein
MRSVGVQKELIPILFDDLRDEDRNVPALERALEFGRKLEERIVHGAVFR